MNMELEFAMLADAANTLQDSRINILGGEIETLYASKFPVVHPHMVLVMRIVGHFTEMQNPHNIVMYLKDADGKDIIKSINLTIPPAPREVPRTIKKFSANLIGQMVNIQFPKKGTYSVEILIDGRHEKSLPLELVEIQQPQHN